MFSPELTTGDDALHTSLMLMFSFLIELTYSSCTTYIVFFMFEFRGDIILVFVCCNLFQVNLQRLQTLF